MQGWEEGSLPMSSRVTVSVFLGLAGWGWVVGAGVWGRPREGSPEGEGGSVREGWGLVQAEGCEWGWGFGVWSGGQVSSTRSLCPKTDPKHRFFFQFFSSPFWVFFEFFLSFFEFFDNRVFLSFFWVFFEFFLSFFWVLFQFFFWARFLSSFGSYRCTRSTGRGGGSVGGARGGGPGPAWSGFQLPSWKIRELQGQEKIGQPEIPSLQSFFSSYRTRKSRGCCRFWLPPNLKVAHALA